VTGRLKDFAPKARVIHVDVDAASINKNRVVDASPSPMTWTTGLVVRRPRLAAARSGGAERRRTATCDACAPGTRSSSQGGQPQAVEALILARTHIWAGRRRPAPDVRRRRVLPALAGRSA